MSSGSDSSRSLPPYIFNTDEVDAYNGIVYKDNESILIRPSDDPEVTQIDSMRVPTPAMNSTSRSSRTRSARERIRSEFVKRLNDLPGAPVSLINIRDETTPSLRFTFVNESVLRKGVERLDSEFVAGCSKCRPDMGQGIGCEYTKICECLEYADVDVGRLDEAQRKIFDPTGDTSGLPKRFPYASSGHRQGCLVDFYLDRRAPIYECNRQCKCGPKCKNRCVQHGRKVKLEIFKTKDRGWGLRAREALRKGEFLDTYRGEIITDEEATRREEEAKTSKESYFYSLDKFADDDIFANEKPYVVDGELMGGPTRFINHSCEPNCRQYTVLYNKYDRRVYELAFFAYRDIRPSEELTFDYLDKEEEDQEAEELTSTQQSEGGKQQIECKCGAQKCRKWLWM
ncbi:SET domain-containing protein [Rhizodiscina lignyota]|uniref:SET domain-containing protein n=1 Tax=Rhizodiscina lignyota TaxID=1504668 RepID=A0A9P4M524_9PEZI|nr:SET domain-containing protein [Rhizodiscina lignyota]